MTLHPSTAARPLPKARAEVCAACRRPLKRDNATDIPHIGLVGPECAQKFGPLLQAIEVAGQIRATREDVGSWRLAQFVLMTLRRCGLEVRVVSIDDNTKELRVEGITPGYKVAGVVTSFRERREEFERQLKLAQAEREVAA